MTRTTGLRKRSEETRHRFAAERSYGGTLMPLATCLQPVAFVHDQKLKSSCVGQAWTGRIESLTGRGRASAVELWTDARRRQGDLLNADTGTDSHQAIESLILRGLSASAPGEDDRSPAEDRELAALAQELAADDTRIPAATEHRVIPNNRVAAVVDALLRGKAVCTGGGVLAAYSYLQPNQVADETQLGGDEGHEQGVAGYIDAHDDRFPAAWRHCFVWANSWGDWSGIVLPCDVTRTDGTVARAGTLLEGCALVKASVIDQQWDVDTLVVNA